MRRRRPTYKQLPLGYDPDELHQPIRPALPPGLRELQHAEDLSDDEVARLQEVAYTARGKKPVRADEWRNFRGVVNRVLGVMNRDRDEQ